MSYAANVLPKYAAYYRLTGASLDNGMLTFNANGKAVIDIDETILTVIPESLLFNIGLASVDTPGYTPEIKAVLDVEMNNGAVQLIEVYHSGNTTDISRIEVPLTGGSYVRGTLTITSKVACSLSVWELCPLQDVDVTTIIDGVEQSLPRVLYDYNTGKLSVEQEESTIAMIACNLLGNTDVNGHLSIDFYSSEYCNVYIRCKDNEVTELYAPLTYTAQPGHNIIGIPHAYLKRLAGLHNFVVTCQCTNGTLTVYPRGILYTIDAGYLAQHLIDAGLDLLDISVKQTKIDYDPEEIWAIGIDANEILVKSRPFSTVASTAWTPQYAMGQGLAAAIEFDGKWVLRNEKVTYTIETYDDPYIFIVEQDGTLVVYYGGDLTTRLVLDTNVSSVCAVRGYKSEKYPDQDQGLLCAYIKNGSAYYRTYAYNAGMYTWYPAEEINIEGSVQHISVHRLNDYRVGILCTTETENIWLISERTYVNQAVPEELIQAKGSIDRVLTSMTKVEVSNEGSQVAFVDPTMPQSVFTIEYELPLGWLTGTPIDSIASVTVNDVLVDIKSVAIQDNLLLVTLMEEATWTSTTNATVKVMIDNSDRYLYLKTSPEGHGLVAASGSFTWLIEKPVITLRGYETERFTFQPVLTTQLAPKPLLTFIEQEVETVNTNTVLIGDAQMKPVRYVTNNPTEVLLPSPNLHVTKLECVQVGDKPI